MASSDFRQRLSSSLVSKADWESGLEGASSRSSRGASKLWMTLDAVTVLVAATLTTLYEFHTSPVKWRAGILAPRPLFRPFDLGSAGLPLRIYLRSHRDQPAAAPLHAETHDEHPE